MIKESPLIFVVDDDPLYHKLLRYKLKDSDYTNVISFSSGEECLENIDKKPEMVILDYNMEGIDGLETLRKIKEKYKDIHVILFSANNDCDLASKSIKNGAQDFVEKNHYAYNKICFIMNKTFSKEKYNPINFNEYSII